MVHTTYAMLLPFAAVLLAMAVLPALPAVSPWWESHLHKFYVVGGLGLLTLIYYLCFHDQRVAGHWPVEYTALPHAGLHWNLVGTMLICVQTSGCWSSPCCCARCCIHWSSWESRRRYSTIRPRAASNCKVTPLPVARRPGRKNGKAAENLLKTRLWWADTCDLPP